MTVDVLTTNEIRDRVPLLNTADVLGGIHIPSDGYANAVDVTQALAKGARNGGAKIYQETLVTAIRRDRDRVTGVSTEHGDIDARNVVICGGMWTRDLAATGPSQIRRVEAGIYSFFQDMRVTDNPYEIGMGRLVDLDMEAEFIGKDALKKINQEGIKRKLVGIEILGDPITKIVPDEYTPAYFVADHWPVVEDGKEVGHVTSKCFSPRLKKNIGYAFLPMASADPENVIKIQSPYADLDAKIVETPFFDPKKDIPKGEVS